MESGSDLIESKRTQNSGNRMISMNRLITAWRITTARLRCSQARAVGQGASEGRIAAAMV